MRDVRPTAPDRGRRMRGCPSCAPLPQSSVSRVRVASVPLTDPSIAHVWCMAVHPCACQCNCARACVHCAQLHVFVEQRTRPVAYEAIRRGWVSAQRVKLCGWGRAFGERHGGVGGDARRRRRFRRCILYSNGVTRITVVTCVWQWNSRRIASRWVCL